MSSDKHEWVLAKKLRLSLRGKILSITVLFIMVMAVTLVFFFVYQQKKIVIADTEKWGISLAMNLAYDSKYGVLVKDTEVLNQLLDNIFKEKNIVQVEIFDKQGVKMADYHQMQTGVTPIPYKFCVPYEFSMSDAKLLAQKTCISVIESNSLRVLVPIKTYKEKQLDVELLIEEDDASLSQASALTDGIIGYIRMEISLAETMRSLARTRNLGILIIGLISIVFGLLLSRFLNALILNPIGLFASGAEVIAAGDYDQQIKISSKDEIGQLAQAFNKMVQNIKKSHQEIQDKADELEQANKELQASTEGLEHVIGETQGLLDNAVEEKSFKVRFHNPGLVRCWEVKQCGQVQCPAYEKEDNRCWHIAGTFCEGEVQGIFAQKLGDCKKCEVYQKAVSTRLYAIGEVFNHLMEIMEEKNDEVKSYAQNLEERVKERTAELERRNRELYQAHENLLERENKLKHAQSQLLLSEKMASLGVLVSGIAHEINTPISAIANASIELRNKMDMLVKGIGVVGDLNKKELDLIKACLTDFTKSGPREVATDKEEMTSLKRVRQVRQYLADLGVENYKEAALLLDKFNMLDKDTIKHYRSLLVNPSIVSFLEAAGTVQLAQEVCHLSAKRITQIVKALKYYAYTDMAELESVDINESIENVLILMSGKFKYRFDIVKKYREVPRVYCTSEINQVWTNLLSNAYDAVMEMGDGYKVKIFIETSDHDSHVEVKIRDNGKNVPKGKIGKIFDPFFTTKGIGKGVGLGLSIVSGILKKHGADIFVESIPGNTTFTVCLPKGTKKKCMLICPNNSGIITSKTTST